MKNITLDGTTVLQFDVDGTDGALDAAADRDALRNDAAFDLCAIADHKIRSAQLAFDSAEDMRWTIAFNFADNRPALFLKLFNMPTSIYCRHYDGRQMFPSFGSTSK